MSYKLYVKDESTKDESYDLFIKKNNINFNEDFTKKSITRKIFKSKPFKLSIALTILLLVLTLTVIGVNHINESKYQEYNFTEEEWGYINLGPSILEAYRNIYNLSDALTKDQYISYSYVTTTFSHYIAGYYDSSKLNESNKLEYITWYMFKNNDIPYMIRECKLVYLIQCDQEYYHKDIITNIEINKTRDRYSKCSYNIDSNNKINNIKRIRFNDVNEETIKCIGRVNSEKELEKFNEGMNLSLLLVFWDSTTIDKHYLENQDYYNIIIMDNNKYVLMDILEEEHNKLLIEQLLLIEQGEVEIEKTYNSDSYKVKRKLYLLEDIISLTINYLK